MGVWKYVMEREERERRERREREERERARLYKVDSKCC